MKRGVVAVLAVGLTLALVVGVYAQMKKDTETGLDRIEGIVSNLDKAKSTLTVTQRSTQAPWKVTYTDQTKFTKRNEAAKLDDLKDGLRVIVLGKYADNVMTASRIDMRTEK